jgi:hypothetical protein
MWLQVLVLVPHGVLGFVAFWFWWPKSKKEWHRFGLVAGYLLMVYLVLRYVFDLR